MPDDLLGVVLAAAVVEEFQNEHFCQAFNCVCGLVNICRLLITD